MSSWKTTAIDWLRQHIRSGTVRWTRKAARESVALSLDENTILEVLLALGTDDLIDRIISNSSGEYLYVFKPLVNDVVIYIKVAFRQECVVISFHLDTGYANDE